MEKKDKKSEKRNLKKPVQLSQLNMMVKDANRRDLRMKMQMADHIARFWKMRMKMAEVTASTLGIKEITFFKLKQEIKNVKFAKFISRNFNKNNEIKFFSDMEIRELLIEYYVERHEIPTKEILMADLKQKQRCCPEDCFNYYLKLHGFIWQRLPGTKKAIIIEHPEQVAERHRYFMKLKQCRDGNIPLVYLEENLNISTNPEMKYTKQTHWCIAVVTENKLLAAFTYLYQLPIRDIDLYKWLKDFVIPVLHKNSVVVIDEKLNNEIDKHQVLNELSSKEEMTQCLLANELPYEENMHKADLWRLVNKFMEKRTSDLGAWFKMYGHEVLRRPKSFEILRVTAPLVRYMEETSANKNALSNTLLNILKGCTGEQWRHLIDRVKTEESKMLKEDLLLEEVIDKLMTLSIEEGLEDCCYMNDLEGDIDKYTVENSGSELVKKPSLVTKDVTETVT